MTKRAWFIFDGFSDAEIALARFLIPDARVMRMDAQRTDPKGRAVIAAIPVPEGSGDDTGQ